MRGKPTAVGDPPTPRQAEILEYIRACGRRWGVTPTIREIANHFGVSAPTGPLSAIAALVRKGLLRRHGAAKGGRYVPVVPPGCCACCGQPLPEEGGEA